jgi:hypothetical protein
LRAKEPKIEHANQAASALQGSKEALEATAPGVMAVFRRTLRTVMLESRG